MRLEHQMASCTSNSEFKESSSSSPATTSANDDAKEVAKKPSSQLTAKGLPYSETPSGRAQMSCDEEKAPACFVSSVGLSKTLVKEGLHPSETKDSVSLDDYPRLTNSNHSTKQAHTIKKTPLFHDQDVSEVSYYEDESSHHDDETVQAHHHHSLLAATTTAAVVSLPGAYSIAGIDTPQPDADVDDEIHDDITNSYRSEIVVSERSSEGSIVQLQAEIYQGSERETKLQRLITEVQENNMKLNEEGKPTAITPSSKGNRGMLIAFSVASVVVVAVVVAVACGVTLSNKNAGEDIVPTLSPSSSSSHDSSLGGYKTSRPTVKPSPTYVPTPGHKCLSTRVELLGAVDAYLENSSAETIVSATFGWPIGSWCTSRVIDFSDIFSSQRNAKAATFNERLDHWDTSSGEAFRNTFYGATLFNQDLFMWDMSKATDISSMFEKAVSFNANISTWNVGKVKGFWSTFASASSFNNSLSDWDMASAVEMDFMFLGSQAFNQNISSWKLPQVTSMNSMFQDAISFNQDLSAWTVGRVTTLKSMFDGASSFNNKLSTWDVANVESLDKMFKESAFNHELSSWNVSNVRSTAFMFQDAKLFDQDLSGWDTRQITSMWSMFEGAAAFNKDLSTWNVSQVTNFQRMFAKAIKFNQDLSSWRFSSASGSTVDFTEMFEGATSFNQSLCAWGRDGLVSQSNPPSVESMFADTSCLNTSDPDLQASPPGPFCSECTK